MGNHLGKGAAGTVGRAVGKETRGFQQNLNLFGAPVFPVPAVNAVKRRTSAMLINNVSEAIFRIAVLVTLMI